MNSPRSGGRTRAFLVRLVLGVLSGQTREEFAEQELLIMGARRQPDIRPV